MLMSEKYTIEELEKGGVKIKYNQILETELWRIDFIKELFELRNWEHEVEGFTPEELEAIQKYFCTKWCFQLKTRVV